jgi:hypothetical protein
MYVLIVTISLHSPEFSGKTNHKEANKAHKECMKQRFIPSFRALARLSGSKCFTVPVNSGL